MEGFSLRNTLNQLFPPKPNFTEKDVPSQAGRVFIVTGGNSGVGFELCKLLFGTGATIYLACRSEERAEKAIQTISGNASQGTPSRLKFLPLDLNDLESVKVAAAKFAQQESKLDVLWNNAGTGAHCIEPWSRTAQALEAFVGMHCVAALLFTELLLPQLRAAADAASASGRQGSVRVVWTSSISADGSPKNGIEFDRLKTGTSDRVRDYSVSKIGTWMLGREFARRHGKEGIISVTQNPGNAKTGSYAGMPAITMLIMNRILHEPKMAGYTGLYSGLSPEITPEHNGAYILPWGRIRPISNWTRKDIINAITAEAEGGLGYDKKFWGWCEAQLNN